MQPQGPPDRDRSLIDTPINKPKSNAVRAKNWFRSSSHYQQAHKSHYKSKRDGQYNWQVIRARKKGSKEKAEMKKKVKDDVLVGR